MQNKKNVKDLSMSIVGEVIEKLMGDSYHSIYLRDPRYFQTVAEKSRKASLDVLFVGKSLKADSEISSGGRPWGNDCQLIKCIGV